jgi:hypothetical protein
MNLDKAIIFDIETVGLLPKIKSFEDLHVLACAFKDKEGKWQTKATKSFEDIQKLVGNPNNTLVCHNLLGYDKPALQKMGFEVKAELIDTLPLSYYLYSERDKHGLAAYGEFFGVPKPEIDDWENLTYEEYEHRVLEDVKINTNLWVMMLEYLRNLYDNDDELIIKTIKYLNFKASKLRCQEENPIYINREQCQKNLDFLEDIIKEKEAELNAVMPKVPVKAKRTKPKVCFKKDESLSSHGEKWFSMLHKLGLPDDFDGVIEEIVKYVEPNCQASQQMKDFLTSLGWKPTLFKDGANGKVPQLRDEDKNLCPNIIKLIETTPCLQALDGLSVAQHRSGYLKGFLAKSDEQGRATAWASAFTRTLRLKHAAPFANLPKPNSQHGGLVRSVMGAPPGYICFGADLSSIEDKCKQISIFPLDPEYVESMNTKGWDAHLALGEKAGMFTADEVQFYKWFKNLGKDNNPYTCPEAYISMSKEDQDHLFHKLDKIRATAKTTNYACLEKNTEVLTVMGWRKYDEILEGDSILSYNSLLDKVELDTVVKKHFFKDKELFEFSSPQEKLMCTEEHRWYGWKMDYKGEKVNKFFETKDISTSHGIVCTKPFIGGKEESISIEDAYFIGLLLSDGYLSWSKKTRGTSNSKGKKQEVRMSISQSINKFTKEVRDAINRVGLKFSERIEKKNNGNDLIHFTVSSPSARGYLDRLFSYRFDKHNFNWSEWVISLPNMIRESFLEGFFLGDGGDKELHLYNAYSIRQNRGNISDALQIAMQLSGRGRVKINGLDKKCQTLRMHNVIDLSFQGLRKKSLGIQDTFCLTTKNSTFIIRQGSTITITGNCTYGAGAAKIAETTEMSLKEAKKLHEGYHAINWSVKKFAQTRKVKTVFGTNWRKLNKKAGGTQQTESAEWVWNEYSNMWLFLKNDKDRFSACNQNFGVKVFDIWAYFLMEEGIRFSGEWHDEEFWYCKDTPEEIERHIQAIKNSIVKVNKYFNPAVPIECDYKIGKTYADVH